MSAESWDKIQRQVILGANLLSTGSASTTATNYAVADIDGAEIGDTGVEFPFNAVNDAILNACDLLISAIGNNKHSPYRSYFQDVTASVASGGLIPTVAATATKSRVGVIGAVRDAANSKECHFQAKQVVQGYSNLILKQTPYIYFDDGVRIWHTRTNVVCDIVVWDKDTQRTALTASPTRGNCPFPQDLHPAIKYGALKQLFRNNFNVEQAQMWGSYFDQILAAIAGNETVAQIKAPTD